MWLLIQIGGTAAAPPPVGTGGSRRVRYNRRHLAEIAEALRKAVRKHEPVKPVKPAPVAAPATVVDPGSAEAIRAQLALLQQALAAEVTAELARREEEDEEETMLLLLS
jgi:hypothetical protein